jgi:hypothetical protein
MKRGRARDREQDWFVNIDMLNSLVYTSVEKEVEAVRGVFNNCGGMRVSSMKGIIKRRRRSSSSVSGSHEV